MRQKIGQSFYRVVVEEGLRFLSLRGRKIMIFVPFFWLLVFFLAPFFIILNISFAETSLKVGGYKTLYKWLDNGIFEIRLNIHNYLHLISDSLYAEAFFNSLRLAFLSTLFSLLLGYPLAYAITQARPGWRAILIMMMMLPFWTSFLIRVYAWIGMLGKHGVVNNFLLGMGVIKEPLALLNNDFSVCLGIVYSYLPFMVLPLYASLLRIDRSLLEAASDLGCRPLKSFFKVTLPLTFSGMMAGGSLVFIPAVGEFVIPELLGGADTLMIGRMMWEEFFINHDWPVASALAISLIIILVLPIMLFQRYRSTRGGEM